MLLETLKGACTESNPSLTRTAPVPTIEAMEAQRERSRTEILAAVDEAEASIARGEGRVITQQSMRELAEDVKKRGRVRLAAEQVSPS